MPRNLPEPFHTTILITFVSLHILFLPEKTFDETL